MALSYSTSLLPVMRSALWVGAGTGVRRSTGTATGMLLKGDGEYMKPPTTGQTCEEWGYVTLLKELPQIEFPWRSQGALGGILPL